MEDRPTIYEHIVAHLPEEGPGLTHGGDLLPDEPDREVRVRLAPGLRDHILDPGPALTGEQTAASLLRSFAAASRDPGSDEPFVLLRRQIVETEFLGFLEPFIRRVYGSRLPRNAVRSVALRLVTESTDRLPVKVGIALLGICARREDSRLLVTIARHAEFTDYAGVAITNAFGEEDHLLWELAKVVEGWGRIALVQQLASTNDPLIRSWILREGGRDYFVLKELPLVVAETGQLRRELEADEIDEELCLAAGEILKTLIENRPDPQSESIDDYSDGPEAIRSYLSHLSRREERLESIQPLATILDYLELLGGVDWNIYPQFREPLVEAVADRPLVGWSDEERTRTATLARWVLQQPGWRRVIEEGFQSSDGYVFFLAERSAARLGDDVFPVLLDRLRRDPNEDEITWEDAARSADEAGVDELLEVAMTRLSAHVPYDGWRFPPWLSAVVDALERFPGKGWLLIQEALTSPVMMERRFGIRGLESFGDKPWPSDAATLLSALVHTDTDEHNRESAAELLESHGYPGRVSTP